MNQTEPAAAEPQAEAVEVTIATGAAEDEAECINVEQEGTSQRIPN